MKYFSQVDITPRLLKSTNPKIGLITLSTDFTIEQDYRKICHSIPVDIFLIKLPY